MARPEVERILVDVYRRIKAHFRDGSLLLLPSDAQFYIHVDAEGRTCRHLTRCALHRHRQQLTRVLTFRNLYSRDSFYETWVMEDELERRKLKGSRVERAVWPCNVEEGLEQGRIVLKGNALYVSAEEDNHGLVYDAVGERVSLRFPLTVSRWGGDDVRLVEEKLLLPEDLAADWLHPLQLAREAVAKLSNCQSSPQNSVQKCQTEEAAEEEERSETGAALEFSRGSWWFRDTAVLPDEVCILLDWHPEVLYSFSPKRREVCAWISRDGSFLQTTHEGRFLQHRRPPLPFQDRIYSSSCVSQNALSDKGEVLYSLSAIAASALQLRSSGCRTVAKKATSVRQAWPEICHRVHEERQLDEGVFTAYVDGRVRVRFTDRTILRLDAAGGSAEMLLPSGERRLVSCRHPTDLYSYLHAATRFQSWAFLTEEQRTQRLQFRDRIELTALRCRLHAALLLRAAKKQSP